MRVAVKDANVFIDMEIAGLLDLWFQLDIETHTTVFIEEELRKGGHSQVLAHFESGMIVRHSLAFEEIAEVDALRGEISAAASFNDCSVLWLAERLQAALLTGDGALRRSGRARSVEVRGTLWVFDRLVEAGLLAPSSAAVKLQTLIDANTYLPEDPCEERLKKWCGG